MSRGVRRENASYFVLVHPTHSPTHPSPVFDANGTNWALSANGAVATSSSVINCASYYSSDPTSTAATLCPTTQLLPAINDGNLGTAFSSSGADQAWLTISFLQPVNVQSVVILARQDCPSCLSAGINASVVLASPSSVITSSQLTDFGGPLLSWNWCVSCFVYGVVVY